MSDTNQINLIIHVQTDNTAPDIMEITFLILKILGLFIALLIGSIIIVPRMLHREKLIIFTILD
jgi:hypothetical protein